jgi:hypothetical protein
MDKKKMKRIQSTVTSVQQPRLPTNLSSQPPSRRSPRRVPATGRGQVGEDMRLQHQAKGSQAGARLAPRHCLAMSLSPTKP